MVSVVHFFTLTDTSLLSCIIYFPFKRAQLITHEHPHQNFRELAMMVAHS